MGATFLVAMLMTAAPATAQPSPAKSFLEQEPIAPPAQGRIFGLAEATRLADARRQMTFGVCGMVIFKEKVGDVWVFQTKIGYGGMPGPDIEVIESPPDIPAFAYEIEASALTAQSRPVGKKPVRSPRVGSSMSFPLRTTRLAYPSDPIGREPVFSGDNDSRLRHPVEFANANRKRRRFDACGVVNDTMEVGGIRTVRTTLGYSGPGSQDPATSERLTRPIFFSDGWNAMLTPQAVTARYGG